MTDAERTRLTESQVLSAREAVDRARAWLAAEGYGLGVAVIDHLWNGAPAADVVVALATYQNEDGGFGRGLEVDIGAPGSNPFATRLAMQVLLDLDAIPHDDLVTRLARWLESAQDPDGNWHFSEETRSGSLAPWFAGWTFPSLNPACCLAGLASQIGIATPTMRERVAALFANLASLDEARSGEFYAILPYVEYAAGVMHPERGAYLDALAENIERRDRDGSFGDPQHFFELALGGGPDLVRRLPPDMVVANADALLATQEEDGGWPSPYSTAWRPWLATESCAILARLRRSV